MASINDTLKITNAMYMISSSKLKKAKKKFDNTEAYFFTLQSQMARILRHVPDLQNIYFDNAERNVDKEHSAKGIIVITGDKGMAGAYNHNVIQLAEQEMSNCSNYKLYVLGELGRHYFEQHGVPIEKSFHYTVQKPTIDRARNIMEAIVDEYRNGNLYEVEIIYTRMVNAMTEEADMQKLLPVKRSDYTTQIPTGIKLEQITFQPSPEEVMNRIVPDFIVGFIYGALVESFSSEQNARMMAMQSASDSAKKMLKSLSVEYNRARQAAITQEITEVCAGAKAQKNKH